MPLTEETPATQLYSRQSTANLAQVGSGGPRPGELRDSAGLRRAALQRAQPPGHRGDLDRLRSDDLLGKLRCQRITPVDEDKARVLQRRRTMAVFRKGAF